MELMQKYPNENDNATIGIENLNRWAPDSEAVNFLSLTASAVSIQVLRKVSKATRIVVGFCSPFVAPAVQEKGHDERAGFVGSIRIVLGSACLQVQRLIRGT